MSYSRYDDDAVFASIIHYIISAAFFVAGTVFLILSLNGSHDLAPLYAIFWGIAFMNLYNVRCIYADNDISNAFVRVLLILISIIGVVAIFGAIFECLGASYPYPYVKIVAFSVLIASVLKIFIENINEFIPAFDNPESDFFRYHSWLIFVGATLLFFSIMYIFFDVYFVFLFLGNWILSYIILSAFRTWFEDRDEIRYLIFAIVAFAVGFILNLSIALAVNDLPNLSASLQNANLFNLASNLYIALAIIMGIGFCFLTQLEYVKDNMSDMAVEILFLVIPLIAFGIQFLAFFYFKAFLIVAGTALLCIALVVLLFRAFMTLIGWIGEGLVATGKGIWYVISFKWITNQWDVLTSRDTKPRSSQRRSNNCSDCKYCSVQQKYKDGDTDTYCSYYNKWCNTLFNTSCKNFDRR